MDPISDRGLGWVAPNTAVGHAVKSGLLYQNKGLKIGQNLLAYSGTPFTPEVVETDALGATVIVPGDYNSATDYVPRFDVRTNVSYQWDYDTFDMSLFLNSSNWLGPINAVTLGIDPEKQDVVGTSSAAFGNRDYEYAFDWTNVLVNLLLSNIGMSFSF